MHPTIKQGLSMQGITLRKINGRNYRLHTATLNNCKPENEDSNTEEIEQCNTITLHVDVAETSIGAIIGRQGETIRKLEQQHRVSINIPNSGNPRDITIQGTQQAVANAHKAINKKIAPKLRPSHFISLPFYDTNFQQKVVELQEKLLHAVNDETSVNGDIRTNSTDKSIYIKPEYLHLTLGVLLLNSKEKVKQAVDILEGSSAEIAKILDNQPLSVEISNLKLMKGAPDQAHVMYLDARDPAGTNKLSQTSALLRERFHQAGLLLEAERSLKLHLTIINTTKRSKTEPTQRKDFLRMPFRATEMLQLYGSYELGVFPCPTIEVARMGSRSPVHGGYIAEGSISV
ncbi:AKAP7 2'5' RNA ligase-like domain-containing protein [Syncephalis plumigaleata]|nr:AKAP7 2'5' RNA ligase-like domain-containing protein [Syncephalis plumigaleata]